MGAGGSWLFVLFFLIYWLSKRFHEIIGGSTTTAYVIAVAGALGYFLSLILHELGHALAARRVGIPVVGIDLWFFGGLLHMRRQPQSASEEFTVAVAGPLVTLGLFALSIALGVVFASGSSFSDAVLVREGVKTTPALALAGWLAFINGALLLFNIIPAFPLDGGRIARALVWWRTGDRNRATLITGRAGQVFALLLGLLGVVGLFGAEPFLGVLTLLLAFFLHQAAAQAVVQGELARRIEHVTVGDIMDREPVTIPAQATLLDAQEQFFLRYRWPWFAVVDAGRHFLGVVREQRVSAEIAAGRPALPVADVLEPDMPVQIGPQAPLESLLGSDGMGQLGSDGGGRQRGRAAGRGHARPRPPGAAPGTSGRLTAPAGRGPVGAGEAAVPRDRGGRGADGA